MKEESWRAYRQLPSAMQALNLVNTFTNVIKKLIKPFLLHYLPSGLQDEHRVGPDVVIELKRWWI